MLQEIIDFCQLYLDDIITKDTQFQCLNSWICDMVYVLIIKDGLIINLDKYDKFNSYLMRCSARGIDITQALTDLHHSLFPDVDVNFECVVEIDN